MALPNSPSLHRGVTLLELLIVLTLMGITAALVVPVFQSRAAAPRAADAALVATARQTAIRRAEPLRLRFSANGSWAITSQRDGGMIDSGHVRDGLPDDELLVDALGGCVPADMTGAVVFDPMSCASVTRAVPR
ncbi:MAG: prepilin-type N-terminal cleavage/methylation domain-containing protein [Gemmatimonadaceae bacterium]|nr:prepilin-type N-terminal cleavage/methylation domain-containing protein [Gemmatimonadaceae bacterium]